MNRKLISGLFVFTLAIAWCACTEDTESRQQAQSVSSPGTSASPKKSSSARTASVWNTEVGGPISYETAQAWIKTYRDKNPDAIRSHFFGKSSFEQIFKNPAAVGISITYAIDDTGTPALLLMAIDADGTIMAKPTAENIKNGTEPSSEVFDMSVKCPDACPLPTSN